MIYKCNCCGQEVDEDDFEIIKEYLDGWVVDEYYKDWCSCGGYFEPTRECENCGERVCKSEIQDGLCEDCYDYERYTKMIKDFKKAQEILEDVNDEVDICNTLDTIVIKKLKEFVNICRILKIKYVKECLNEKTKELVVGLSFDVHLSTVYDGVKIVMVTNEEEFNKVKNIKKYCKNI